MTQKKEPSKQGTRGRVIYDARRKLGLSQASLARRLGTSRENVVRWENNKVRPGLDFSEALAEELKVPLKAILDPAVAHVRRNQDKRVGVLLQETATLRAALVECLRENRQLQRAVERLAS